MSERNDWAGVLVIFKDGKRLSWTTHRGMIPRAGDCDGRYFNGHDPDTCTNEIAVFSDPGAFEKAEAWASRFPAHQDEAGREPQADMEDDDACLPAPASLPVIRPLIPPGHVGIVDPSAVPLVDAKTCRVHGPTVAVTWITLGPCPLCVAYDRERRLREALEETP